MVSGHLRRLALLTMLNYDLKVACQKGKVACQKGTDIYLRATNNLICPVLALIPYLARRGSQPGPLFVTSDHWYLTRTLFSQKLDALLGQLQIDTQQYNTHSFRIGAATTAAQAHISDAHIKMLGRWRSDAYQRYIRTPRQQLAELTKRLASAPTLFLDAAFKTLL